jgi:ribose/xylose/arabinose/galactoside ABC-type transport system permease subunit
MRTWLLPLFLLLEIALFALVSGNPLPGSARYWQSYFADLLAHATPILLLGFGMTLVLITAGIDLSVGSMVALIACVMSSFAPGPNFWWTAVPAGLAMGLALGFLNGFLIARLDVPPIIATLGTMIFYRGLCFVLMGDLEKSPFVEVPGYEWFGTLAGALLLLLLVYLGAGQYFLHSCWRRELLMIGGNRIAARYAGIPVEKRLLQTYLIVGLLAFLAALCFTARNSSVIASSLTGMELQVIVAVVLGGTRVQGGSGSLLGTFFGVLLIAVLQEGLRGAAIWGGKFLPFKISHLEYVLLGLLLLGGVWASTRSKGRLPE